MKPFALRALLYGLVLVALTIVMPADASAQCATCPTAVVPATTVAYSPVVTQPTVAYRPYTGWYPGKWLDQWRMRRAGVAATVPAYSAAYAPTYRSAYAASYTASYAPTYSVGYTAAYQPYVSSYAPLSSPVAQSCNTCVQTVARPVLMRPVVAAPACNTCSFTPDCGCDTCASSGVSQAVYSEPACSSCAGSSVTSSVVPPASSALPNVGPQTRQPDYAPVPSAADSEYRSNRQIDEGRSPAVDPTSDDYDPLEKFDPGPKGDLDPSTYNAPRLLDPRDRTARSTHRKPTVDVWTAVYRGPAQDRRVQQTSSRRTRSRAELDAEGWTAVPPSNR